MAESKSPPKPYDEAVYFQRDDNGNALTGGALSVTDIEVVDLLGEGEFQGLVTGEYPVTGLSGYAGQIGWIRKNFVPYPVAPETSARYLRSIYWNETPIVSSDNKYNYQRISLSATNGSPTGELLNSTNQELTISRQINERLRGSISNIDGSLSDANRDYAKYYRILNKECRGAYINIKFAYLYSFIVNGDDERIGLQKDTSVEYNIYYRPLFSSAIPTENSFILAKKEVIQGKITQGYIKSTRIDFLGSFPEQPGFLGYEIKIVRLTPDFINTTTNEDIKNTTFVDSITEIYNKTFLYPNSAMVRSKFSSEFFSSIPSRSYDVEMLKVKVPNTYNAVLKTYTESAGGWDGTFKTAKEFTDNPAWCYYDLLTNRRYGLGNYIDETYVDKWTLYEIAKYCDTLVPDGFGSLEPRFTCNLYIASREEAYKVVNDMASIFRGISYYSHGNIYTAQDSPKDPIYIFTNSNVKDGNFSYQSSSRRVRNSVAIVRFNDKDNFYKPAIEYVEDSESIRQYGIRTTEVTAFGCSSRGQANRLGKWKLISENLETETIAFNGGLECSFLRPGDIIKTFDSNKKSLRLAGRTAFIYNVSGVGQTGAIVTLDAPISLPTGGVYSFNLLTPTYYYDPTLVTGIKSSGYIDIRRNQIQSLNFTGKFLSGVTGSDNNIRGQITFHGRSFDSGNYITTGNLIWTIDLIFGLNSNVSGINGYSDSSTYIDSNYDWWRVVSIKEENQGEFSVNGVQHNPNKFALVETGLYFKSPVDQPNTTPETPSSIVVAEAKASRYSKKLLFSVVNSSSDDGITSYRIYSKQDTGFLTGAQLPSDDFLIASVPRDEAVSYYNIPNTGTFVFRAYGVNDVNGRYSTGYATGLAVVGGHYPIQDVAISSLNLSYSNATHSGFRWTGINIDLDPEFKWQVGLDQDSTLGQNFSYLISLRSPSSSNTPSNTIYYQWTGVAADPQNPYFRFYFNQNSLISGGPYRDYDLIVEAMDSSGRTSAGNQLGGTESWSNPYGYDILYVSYPRFTGFFLSTGSGFTNSYATEQWIDSDGSPCFRLVSGALPNNIRGGFIYTSSGKFTSGDIRSGVNMSALGMLPFNLGSNLFKSASKLSQFNSGWMSVSFYDSFDEQLGLRGYPIEYYLPVSNIVPIYGTGSFYSTRITNNLDIIDPSDYLSSSRYTTETVTEDGVQYVVTYMTDEEGIKKVVGSRVK